MYNNQDKRKLYQLMEMYIQDSIDAWTFCNEYYYCYDIGLDVNSLTELEAKCFADLSIVSGRFTDIEDDIKKYPGTYFTEEHLRQKVFETIEKLKA